MRILYSPQFHKKFHRLPANIQSLFRKQEKIFLQNWKDSRLQTKKLKGYSFGFSFRITRRYRVIFIFVKQETVLLAEIGHRKDIYR
jgi:mRNA-degrading endonuclease RelE of RelBE toxin-antitoxin system